MNVSDWAYTTRTPQGWLTLVTSLGAAREDSVVMTHYHTIITYILTNGGYDRRYFKTVTNQLKEYANGVERYSLAYSATERVLYVYRGG